jgi:type III secretory pathway component EscR
MYGCNLIFGPRPDWRVCLCKAARSSACSPATAFMLSELRAAFVAGFVIFLPFLLIDG